MLYELEILMRKIFNRKNIGAGDIYIFFYTKYDINIQFTRGDIYIFLYEI